MLAVTFDPTINLGQIITILGGLLMFGRLLLGMQNLLRDHSRDIKELKECSDAHETKLAAHDTWLVRAGLDQRSGSDRRTRGEKADA